MAKLEIQIQIRKMLKPSTPTPNHLQSHNLSLFDQLAPCMYVSVLLHYLPSSEWKNTERCDKLQKSLADTLTKFYPLAGRFIKEDLSIHCNDEGVEYVETKVNTNLAEFLREGPKIELLNDLLPRCAPPNEDMTSCPLLGIQANIFNCGGLVMGIQIAHILADAFTLATFLNEWALISLTGTTNGCVSSFSHLPSLFPKRVLSAPSQSLPLPQEGAKIVMKRFVFDALAIAKLKGKVNSTAAFTKPTRVVVVMSLIWKVLVGISTTKHGRSRHSTLKFVVNMRGKSTLPSTEHALGNFGTTGVAILEANQSRHELNDFVNLVRSASRDTSVSIGKASIDDITSMFVNCDTGVVVNNSCQKDDMDIFVSSSWCRFPWYETDFGWGKPFWVSSVSQDAFEVIGLFDTNDGDGIEAWDIDVVVMSRWKTSRNRLNCRATDPELEICPSRSGSTSRDRAED